MKKTTRNTLIIITVAIVLLAAAAFYCLQTKEPTQDYETQTAQRGNIESSVLAIGMLQASKLVSVGSQVSGQVLNLPVPLGGHVNKGDLIAEIDNLTQKNDLETAKASLTITNAEYKAKQAQINQAQKAFNRQKAMFKENASSKEDYEIAEADLAVYKAELDQLKAEKIQNQLSIESAELDLGYTTIKAPIEGVVVYNSVEVGQTVNASQTTPTLVELADLSKMTIKAQISEADVINVKPGQAVYFTILGQPNKRYEAKLRAIEPGPTSMDGDDSDMISSDSDAIYYNGLFEVDNPEGVLRIGMTAQVSIILSEAKDTLLVPSQVIQKHTGRSVRYQVPVLENDKVIHKKVEVGISNNVNTEITDGLTEDDQIVIGSAAENAPKRTRKSRSPMGL
ncbi:efflux RND transporter periplasmic adaptor subunit [uncultured Psychromonas sp.]|uniref:efflux RND transporter periplasmic adaptor subunit n=1 Tax=uncultured Psychromonas sp. TaxID=173974 RepID=UPI00261EBF48|nr:efflux RND transporter periplasmic adaptor subunit [uncultured Psychromonas sp.]